jgi:hypothetical protein
MPLTDRDKRTLKYGGIAVGALLVLFLGSKLLFGGGGEEPAATGTTRRPSATPTPTPTPTATQTPVAQFAGRDPFSTPPEFLVGGTPSGPGGSTSTASSPGGSSSSPGGSTTSPPPSQPGGGSSSNLGGHSVVLLDVFSRGGVGQAQVEIDGVVYTVAVGERFGPGNRFELRSVSGNCGTFVFGDESFTLCITPSK